MQLHYRSLGRGDQSILILHGLFGSSDNWLSFARHLGEKYTVYLLDLRNHGRSPHSDLHNYMVMAEDVLTFILEHKLKKPHIIGHSMGGKVAMRMSFEAPQQFDKLIIIDITPKTYPVRHQEILSGLNALVLQDLKNRTQAFETLGDTITDIATRHFLLKNLKHHHNGHFYWGFNLSVITRTIGLIAAYPAIRKTFDRPVLFIRGGKSNYIQDEDKSIICQYYPQAQIETITEAGHWIHAEKPKELLELILKNLEL